MTASRCGGTETTTDEEGLCMLCGRLRGDGDYMCPKYDGRECFRYIDAVCDSDVRLDETTQAERVVTEHLNAKRAAEEPTP